MEGISNLPLQRSEPDTSDTSFPIQKQTSALGADLSSVK